MTWPALILVLILVPGPLGSAAREDYSSSASQLHPLQVQGASARGAGMSGSLMASGDEVGGPAFNPGGLGLLKRPHLGAHHNAWLVGTNQDSFWAALPLSGIPGNFLGGVDRVDYGTLEGRDAQGQRSGDFQASETRLSLGWGLSPLPGIGLGASLKGTQQVVAQQSDLSLGAGLGLLARPRPWLGLALGLDNLGRPLDLEDQSWTLSAGTSIVAVDGFGGRILVCLASALLAGDEGDWRLGIEYRFRDAAAVRCGFHQPWARSLPVNQAGSASLGLGLSLKNIWLDWAFIPFADFDAAHRLSLSWSWDAPPPPLPMAPAPARVAAPRPAPTPTPAPTPAAGGLLYQVLSGSALKARDLEAYGLLPEAEAEYRRGLEADPKDSSCWRGLARLLKAQGRTGEAHRAWESLFECTPGDEEALRELQDPKER